MTTSQNSYTVILAGETAIMVEELQDRIDGYYSEEHEVRVNTTRYPVESGASLTDHAVRQPYQLKIKGIVSDVVPGEGASRFITLAQRASYGWNEIIKRTNTFETVTVMTHLGGYRNMLITDAKSKVDESTGLSLDVDIELTEILRANITRTTVALPQPTQGPAVDRQADTQRGRVTSQVQQAARVRELSNRLSSGVG